MSATNRGAIRNERDFYPTPITAFTPLFPYIPKYRTIWEPAKGDGRLVFELRRNGFFAYGNDLNAGYDFLKDDSIREVIITNPPFSLGLEFAQNAVRLSSTVFMLLPLNFLGSLKRREWFVKNEPSALFVLSKRPSFLPNGKTDASEYAWFYWGGDHKGIYHL